MEEPMPGEIKGIYIQNVVATGAKRPCAITGIPRVPVKAVSISNTRIAYQGGGRPEEGQIQVPERANYYPSP
jgi:hypothetical protein